MNIRGYEKALSLLGKGKFKEAKSAFEKLAEKADDAQFREKCNSHVRYCKQKQSENENKKDIDPFGRAVFLINEELFDESLSILKPLLKTDPENDILLYTIAIAFAGKKDESQALKYLKNAISLNSTNKFHAEREELFSQLKEKLATL